MTGQQMVVEGAVEGAIATRKVQSRKVVQRIMTANEVLEENEWLGKYIPIVRVLGRELDIEGETYMKGMVRDLKDPARLYNYTRSASAERTALAPKAPWVGPKGSFRNQKWRTANKKNHAYLEYDVVPGQNPPWRDKPPEASSALITETQQSSEEMKAITGIYDPGLGDRSNEVSGVAVNARQGRSDISNFDFVDNLARSMTYAGKVLVDLIPKIYGGPRMLRIVKPDGSDESVQVNSPYIDEQQRPRNYQLNAGRYDVSVDVGPSYATQRQEAAESMLEFVKGFPAAAQVTGDLMAKNFDWPESDEISKRLKLLLPPELLADENPQFRMAIQQKDQQIQAMQGQMGQLAQALQQMQLQLENKQGELKVKQGELAQKIQKTINDHIEGMTGLELEAGRDLNQAGAAYGGGNGM